VVAGRVLIVGDRSQRDKSGHSLTFINHPVMFKRRTDTMAFIGQTSVRATGEPSMLTVTLINALVVMLVVVIHYECLLRLNDWLPRLKLWSRFRIVIGVFGALAAHALEVWCFALAYYLMANAKGWGTLSGNFDGTFMDCVYFSFTTYTTIGFGDIAPSGDLKYLTGLQALTGLVMITWTASFLFLEMQKYWKTK